MSDLAQRLAWLDEGSELFLAELETVRDSDFGDDTALPGWTVAHLVAHVGYNAKALSRLVHWARTGEETPMYASAEARDSEIEAGSRLLALELRDLVRETDDRLRTELAGLSSWDSEVRTAQGRTVTADEIPWMRVREVWIHTVDLGTGKDFRDFPVALLEALITDNVTLRAQRDQGPALLLRAEDTDREWRIDRGNEEPTVVAADSAELCRWLAGRGAIDGPELARWL
ncbi:maleylpyruvate isomerase family mycothiol-dependent enzyme [Amycolatopsis sp.]|uniref:maleylpyruvate isomerase family mycothiol-dependent enzyme n=1 Tax=Amycolatopsis sp. TaxID=37632 RepID=UPI002B9E7696|nr:maleylpyruvate isomerase family mycothiol-dependent enzyme [Amycolatopsis sp.]HVV08861.1 maleylpyruvate isomerase family mycothiol-dependent enzyme [Amycolatopsis sp.]